MISFDQILENRIGTGFYQWKTLSIIGLVELCDGIKYTFMSIVIAILKKEWNLTSQQIASLGSIFLFGILIGNFLCAFLTDQIGRKTTFTLSIGLAVVLVYYISYCQNFQEMIILRLLFGLVYGITYPLGFIFISEISVANYRGRFSLGLSLIYIFGKIYFVLLCFIYLEDFTTGNWRGLIRFNGIPVIVAFLLSLIFLHETVRYLLNKRQFQQAFEEIEFVLQQNNQQEAQLTEEEKQGLQNWNNQQQLEHQEQELNKFGVLSPEYRKMTIILWFLYILTNLQNMSIYLLMPFLFAQNNSDFLPLLTIFLVEFAFALVLYQFIDDPNYGGRIRTILYSGIALVISNGLLFFFKEKYLYFGLFIIKIATRGLFSTIGLVCCEIYPLQIRSQGCGIAQAIGKIAAIPSPYFLFPLFYIEPYLPFGLMFLLSILVLILALNISQDKTQKYLETIKKE